MHLQQASKEPQPVELGMATCTQQQSLLIQQGSKGRFGWQDDDHLHRHAELLILRSAKRCHFAREMRSLDCAKEKTPTLKSLGMTKLPGMTTKVLGW
jgi:hypothetical protein